MRRGFTLVELIASIAILALITVTLVVTIPNFINWARETADRQTLTVLNDALNRYKTQGGDVNVLTTGTPIAHVVSKLQTSVTWAGKGHEFLSGGRTFLGRSIAALGEHHQYHFTRYDHYEAEAGGSSPVASNYPYGEGVGYMSNGGDSGGYPNVLIAVANTGFYTMLPEGGSPTTYVNNYNWISLGVADSYTFWASDSDGNPSGEIVSFGVTDSQIISLNVSGLTNATYINCRGNSLSSIDVSGHTSLQELYCRDNQITELDVSGAPNIQFVTYFNNPFSENAATLNAFYDSLPAWAPMSAMLWENPADVGTSNGVGDSSIATNKGWFFGEI